MSDQEQATNGSTIEGSASKSQATGRQETAAQAAVTHALEVQEAEAQVDTQSIARAHEVHDINIRAITLFGVALLAIILVSLYALRAMAGMWSGEPLTVDARIAPSEATAPAAPGPGVEAKPAVELEQVLAPQRERMNSYGWIDKNAGTIHVPIERAMTLLLEEGLPARDSEPPTFTLPSAYKLDGSGGQETTK